MNSAFITNFDKKHKEIYLLAIKLANKKGSLFVSRAERGMEKTCYSLRARDTKSNRNLNEFWYIFDLIAVLAKAHNGY